MENRKKYRYYIKKNEYTTLPGKLVNKYKLGHIAQNKYGKEYKEFIDDVFSNDVVQGMKKFSHHGRTSLFGHSVHVSYYNYLICRKLGLDHKAGARAGLLHDLFLYDWHTYDRQAGERLHGFEHPNKALKNAGKHFKLTRKEGDMIAKHMFPLTITPPKYLESIVIIMVDKFCSICEIMDDFYRRKFRGAKDVRIKWFGDSKGQARQ